MRRRSRAEAEAEPPRLPHGPRPPLAGQVVRAETGDIAVLARPLLVRTTGRDGIFVALHWTRADGAPLGPDDPRGGQDVNWQATVGSLGVTLRGPGDAAPRELAVGGQDRRLLARPLYRGATLQLSLRESGVLVGSIERPWAAPVPGLLSAPGDYRVALRGSLALAGGPVPFATSEVPITIVADDAMAPLPELEVAAARAVAAARQLAEVPQADRATLDDVEGNRVVRLSPLIGDARLFVEVVVSPAGEMVSGWEERYRPPPKDDWSARDPWSRLWQRVGDAP